jgi:hypothetical protein
MEFLNASPATEGMHGSAISVTLRRLNAGDWLRVISDVSGLGQMLDFKHYSASVPVVKNIYQGALHAEQCHP